MKKFKIISYQIYPFDLIFTVGTTEKEVQNFIEKKSGYILTNEEKECLTFNGIGRTCMIEGGQTVLWLKSFNKKKPSDYGTIAHEVSHAVSFLFNRIDIKISNDSEEAFTYLVGYITTRIMAILLK